jgi:hypothetical protein
MLEIGNVNTTDASSGAGNVNTMDASSGAGNVNTTDASSGAENVNTMDAPSGAGNAYDSGATEFTHVFYGVRVAQSLVFCVVFCR